MSAKGVEKIKADYLNENRELKLIENSRNATETTGYFDDYIDDDDVEKSEEIWLVQCPNNINLIEQLKNQNIKIPGKTHIQSIETISEEFSNPKYLTLAYKSDDKYSIRTLSASGRILIRERIKQITNNDNENVESDDAIHDVPTIPLPLLPDGLKQRHPLFGANYEDKLILNDEIVNRIRHAEETCNREMRIKKEVDGIDDASVHNDAKEVERKSKKKKRKNDNKERGEVSHEKKIKKENSPDDEENDLSWIRNL